VRFDGLGVVTFVGKSFPKERKMIMKQVNFQERKSPQIAPERSALTSTSQKDSPLSHKGVNLI